MDCCTMASNGMYQNVHTLLCEAKTPLTCGFPPLPHPFPFTP